MKSLTSLSLIATLCLCLFGPALSQAVAAPVPATAVTSLSDANGNTPTLPIAAGTTFPGKLVLTNTQTPSTPALTSTATTLITTPGTNPAPSTVPGTRTTSDVWAASSAVSHDLSNVTVRVTAADGWVFVSSTNASFVIAADGKSALYTQATLPGGASVTVPFQVATTKLVVGQ